MIKFQSFLSSSSGNSTFVSNDNIHLLVDCGAGGKYITECMRRIGILPENLSGILITHEHRDHVAGVGVLSRKFNIPVYATEKTWKAIGNTLGNFSPENRRLVEKNMTIGDMKVESFAIPHDASAPVGYSFLSGDDKFTIATDIGHIRNDLLEHLKGSRCVIIEANHDVELLKNGRYPYLLKKRILGDKGHLSNTLCGKICVELAKSGTDTFWLGHLSNENNRPELAYQAVASALEKADFTIGSGISLQVLPRYWIA